jgi:hypothetical protein
METELGFLVLRESELHSLYRLMQLVSEILFNNGDQGFDLFRLQRAYASALHDLPYIVGAKEGQIMPAFEIGIDPRWNCGKDFIQGAGSEFDPNAGDTNLRTMRASNTSPARPTPL